MSECESLGRLTLVLFQDIKCEDLRTYPIAEVVCGVIMLNTVVLCCPMTAFFSFGYQWSVNFQKHLKYELAILWNVL